MINKFGYETAKKDQYIGILVYEGVELVIFPVGEHV